jgi:hypothetical protein
MPRPFSRTRALIAGLALVASGALPQGVVGAADAAPPPPPHPCLQRLVGVASQRRVGQSRQLDERCAE